MFRTRVDLRAGGTLWPRPLSRAHLDHLELSIADIAYSPNLSQRRLGRVFAACETTGGGGL